jgi:molybdopterin molybdotransferase
MPTTNLLSVEQAQDLLLSQLKPIAATETISLAVASWRVLASDVKSNIELPPANLSMMDGYAVASDGELGQNRCFTLTQSISAGEAAEKPFNAGEAARIFTGAQLPAGADTVVMQEHVSINGQQVCLQRPYKKGQHIRWQGEEIHIGQVLLQAGCRLTPAAIGLCASVGLDRLPVFRNITVALLVTGSELVAPGQPLTSGKIYNANLYLLEALLRANGFNVVNMGIVPDTLQDTVNRLKDAADFDAIITTGGVSVGDKDFVKAAVDQLGHINAWRVRMKPGKPFAFGCVGQTPFFGLPGNPVAAFTCFYLFALPALRRLQGLPDMKIEAEPVTADFYFTAGERREYLRARLITQLGQRIAQIYPNQGSAVLASTVWAEGFVVVPEGNTVKPGDRIAFISFNQFRQ